MFKNFSVLFMFVSFFLFNYSLRPQGVVEIGTGTGYQRQPLGIYYGYERAAALYTAAEIGPPKSIQALGWYISINSGQSIPAKIYLKKTTSVSMTSNTWSSMIAGATLVYEGSLTCNSSGWKSIDIDDFSYDQDNLLVLCETNYGGTGTSSYPQFRYTSSGSNLFQSWASDNSIPLDVGTLSTNRPNMQIYYLLGDMSFSSATTQQGTTARVLVGDINQEIIKLNIVTSGAQNPISVSSITFNTNGTTSSLDVTRASAYYTTTDNFSTAIPFGSPVSNPSGSFSVTGNQVLSNGNNFFWLAYDISGSATAGNFVDAECSQFITSETGEALRIPDITSPAGSREIKTPMSGTYSIKNSGGDFSSLYAAVSQLNAVGLSGSVIFNIQDGETFDEPGLSNITVSGTIEKTITIRQSGEGAKPVLIFTGTTGNSDAAIKLSSASYVAIEGLDIRNGEGNIVEYGIYMLGTSTTGCRYNLVRDCSIALSLNSTYTKAIYLFSSASSNAAANSYNKFYNNIIRSSYYGYYLTASGSYPDSSNEVGTIDGGISTLRNCERAGIGLSYQVNFNVFNNDISFSSTLGYYTGIEIQNGSNTGNIYGNTIHHMNHSAGISGNSGYGMYLTSGANIHVYKNLIHSCTINDGSFTGIFAGRITTLHLFKNQIYEITNQSSNQKDISGITLDFGEMTAYIYNNFIWGLSAPSSSGFSVRGLKLMGSSTPSNYYLFHNTVNIAFESSNAGNIAAAYYSNDDPAVIDLRNNIFECILSGTYSKSLGHYRYASDFTNISANSNNNIYFSGTPSASNLICYDSYTPASYQTLADYKTVLVTKEQSSFSEDVPFVSVSNPHIKSDVPTRVKGSGQRISTPFLITDDIDDEIRNQTFPDIGADAGNFIAIDEIPPVIEYSALTSTTSTDSRTLSVSIEDLSGINTSSAKPRIYFKKSTNTNNLNDNTNSTDGWKYSESFSSSSPFEFTINYGLIFGGVTSGDSIQYFIVAQDVATTPNAAINSGTLNAPVTGVGLTAPHFPLSGMINGYKIVGMITGTFTVGVGGDFATLTLAAADYNMKQQTGPVVFSLIDDTYPGETFPIVFNENAGSSETNTITIKPASGKTPVISGSSSQALIKLYGADYFIIDGSNGAKGTDRSLTFANTYTSFSGTSSSIWLAGASAGAGCHHVTVKNCKLTSGYNSSGYYIVFFAGGNTIGSDGYDHDFLTLDNNELYNSAYGIYLFGRTGGKYNNISITNNTIGASTGKLGNMALYLYNCEDVIVRGNTIQNVEYGSSSLTAVLLSAGVRNVMFENNDIHSVRASTSSSGGGACGLEINTAENPANITLSNNIFYNISGSGYTAGSNRAVTGIKLSSANGVYLYYNSVNLYGNCNRSSATSDASYALYINGGSTGVTLKNNVFKNSLENTTGVSTAYAIYSAAPNTNFASIDYNNYFGGGNEGVLGFLGSARLTIADWRTATGQDIHSQNTNTYFQSNSALYVPNNSSIIGGGTPVIGITSDYAGTLRNETIPTIGAFETGYNPTPIGWCNLQSPGTYSKGEGTLGFDIYARVYIDGITATAGATTDLEAYIGYSTVNTNPNTWTNWTRATFNVQSENNDEFKLTLGENFAQGTYYFAAKFVYKGMEPRYGGYSSGGGGFWDGTIYVSGVLTVISSTIGWCNLQHPSTVTQSEGGSFTVYGRVYSDGITTLNGEQPGLKAWVGWNYTNTDPSTWSESQWAEASFYAEYENNDEYSVDIGQNIQMGTAYYATRFQILSGSYSYGGYSVSGGGFWDNNSHVSGVATVNEKIVSSFPSFEGMERGYAPPAGWRDADNKWILGDNSWAGDFAIGIEYDQNGTLTTNKFVLPANMRMSFYWQDDDPFSGPLKMVDKKSNSINGIEEEPYDRTFFEITTDNGNNWTTLATLSDQQNYGSYDREVYDLSSYGGNTVSFRWRNVTDQSFDATGFLLDNLKIEKTPTAISTKTISSFWGIYDFTGTDINLSSVDNTWYPIEITVEKIEGSPGGILPGTLNNFAPYYWVIIPDENTDNECYAIIKIDVAGLSGINDYWDLHLLKRDNPSDTWIDLGTPYSVSGTILSFEIENGFSEFVIAADETNPLPVELAMFNASANKRDITLTWRTETEVNTSHFSVEKKSGNGEWLKIGEVKAAGNSNSPKNYSFTETLLNCGLHTYRLKITDNDGTFKYSLETDASVDIPSVYALSQNYPNPFNPATVISYQLPEDSKVVLELFNITGEKVAILINEEKPAGYYNYNLLATTLSSGVYFYKFTSGNFIGIKKMILIK